MRCCMIGDVIVDMMSSYCGWRFVVVVFHVVETMSGSTAMTSPRGLASPEITGERRMAVTWLMPFRRPLYCRDGAIIFFCRWL